MIPQITRKPLFPAGFIISSSGLSMATSEVPLAVNNVVGPGDNVTRVVVIFICPIPSSLTSRLGKSPAWGPFGLFRPCSLLKGL